MSESLQRVLIVNRTLPCHVRGGLEFHVLDLASGLARAGVAVELLTAPVSEAYRRELEAEGLTLHCVPGVTETRRYTAAWLRGVGAAIERLAAERAYDIIHGHEFGFGFWRPGAEQKSKIVLTVHGTITTETPLHPDVFGELSLAGKARALARFGRRFAFAPAWGRMLEHADAILVDSKFTETELARIKPGIAGKVRHVPLGVDMARQARADAAEPDRAAARRELGWEQTGAPARRADGHDATPRQNVSVQEETLVLLTVGRLEWQKGHDIALRALAGLKDQSWRYVIAGEGTARAGIERQVRQLGLAERVEFAGRVEDRVKSLILAGADLFLWPERTHPAFGLVGLEAMLMNTPVLGMRRGAIPEVLDDPSCRVADGAAGFERTLTELLGSGRAGLANARAGLRERTLARFNPEAMVRETMKVYRDLPGGERIQ